MLTKPKSRRNRILTLWITFRIRRQVSATCLTDGHLCQCLYHKHWTNNTNSFGLCFCVFTFFLIQIFWTHLINFPQNWDFNPIRFIFVCYVFLFLLFFCLKKQVCNCWFSAPVCQRSFHCQNLMTLECCATNVCLENSSSNIFIVLHHPPFPHTHLFGTVAAVRLLSHCAGASGIFFPTMHFSYELSFGTGHHGYTFPAVQKVPRMWHYVHKQWSCHVCLLFSTNPQTGDPGILNLLLQLFASHSHPTDDDVAIVSCLSACLSIHPWHHPWIW